MGPVTLLHLIDTLRFGGAERLLLQLVTRLPGERYRVLVGTVTDRGPLANELEKVGISVHYMGGRGRRDARVLPKLVQLMRREKVVMLHTHLFVDGFWGRLAAMAAGVPVRIATQHNSYEGGNLPPRWQIWADRVLWRYTDRFVVVSDGSEKFLLNEIGVPREKVRMIPNAVAPLSPPSPEVVEKLRQEWGLVDARPVLGTVARLTQQKGIGYLLEALALLLPQYPNIRGVVLGEGDLRDELEAKARSLGISGSVVFAGVRKDVENVLALFDLFVLPSLYEGMPVALLEAMSVGLPVVATRLASVSEVIEEGVDGILASPGDGRALAGVIADALKAPETLRQMGENARKKIRSRYSVENWVASYDELYQSLLREAGLV